MTLSKKLKARETARKTVDKNLDKADELIKNFLPDKFAELFSLRDTLVEKFTKIKTLDEQIFSLINEKEGDENEAELEIEDENANTFTLHVKTELFKINTFIETHQKPTNIQSSIPTNTASPSHRNVVKLPNITLKKFDGEPENWQTFYDNFECAIHNNPDISNVQKMSYLDSLCEGKASDIIYGLKLSNENYEIALKLLKERYDDKQLLIHSHMQKLLNLKPIENVKEICLLRKIYDIIEIQIRSLENLGYESDRYGPLLIPIITSKLPQELNLLISRQFESSESWEIDQVLKTLKTEITAREKTSVVSKENETPDDFSEKPISGASLANGATFLKCLFCDKKHKSEKCRIVTEIQARKNILKKKKLCFICLKAHHVAKDCKSKISCFNCKKRHHAAVCSPENTESDSHLTNIANSQGSTSVLLQTAKVQVKNKTTGQIIQARVLFDSCSQLSYATPSLKRKLKLTSKKQRDISIQAFGKNDTRNTLEQIDLVILSKDRKEIPISCFVNEICTPITSQKLNFAKENYSHLKNVDLADSNIDNKNLEIDILVGADFYWDIVFLDGSVRGNNGPVALNTRVGYVLSGPITSSSNENEHNSVMLTHVMKVQAEIISENYLLMNDYSKVWNEKSNFKNTNFENNDNLDNEFNFEKYIDESIVFDTLKKRYEIEFPFKSYCDILSDNYSNCQKRISVLSKKLSKNEKLLNDYNSIIKEQLSNNVIEKVPVDQNENINVGSIHYLPHRPVVKEERETTKVRMVFDASSKITGPSLNECLYSGPSITEPLFSILLRFRVDRIALIADIEKAFLQISVSPKHRDFIRFLWYSDIENISSSNILNAEITEYRLCRLLFGVTSSPFILSATLQKHINSYQNNDSYFTAKLLKSLHVDDLNTGVDSVQEGLCFYNKAKDLLSHASFNLRKFRSNSTELEMLINKTNSTQDKVKVLGILWDKNTDELIYNTDVILKSAKDIPTKRDLLSFLASIYDPFGHLNPFVFRLKTLFQKVCLKKLLWEDCLVDELLLEWQTILRDLKVSNGVKLCRWYGDYRRSVDVELHGFADASLKGYGCCVYIRFCGDDGVYHVSLVSAQSRVASIKSSTVPKLELNAALLLAKHVNSVKNELSFLIPIKSVILYTDSTITLSWIKSTKKLQPYVERRVIQIRKLFNTEHWHHVTTSINPADLISRGCLFSELERSRFWFDGPKFLWGEFAFGQIGVVVGEDCCLEEEVMGSTKVCLLAKENNTINLNFLKLDKFSSYIRLINVTALVLRFIDNLKKKRSKETIITHGFITIEEKIKAEDLWIKFIQMDIYKLDSYKQLKKDLNLFVEDGIIRCQGRLKNAPLNYSAKFPILLPSKHYFTDLIIKYYHNMVLHNGMKETLNQIRSKYWIPKIRNHIKRIIRKCLTCQKFEGKSFVYPPPPDLPKIRLSKDYPFTYTGVDYAGPLYVKDIYSKDGMFKCWIFLYTCASTRNLFLDLVPDCYSSTCIRALTRFFCNRGTPNLILSDNGSQFISTETQAFATNKGVTWKFNLAAAPWWGGLFERFVRSVKRCLKKVLNNLRLDYEHMLTLLAQIQVVINNRPLTFMYDEPGEEVLTPNHLLFGRKINLESYGQPENFDVNIDVNKQYKHLETVLNHFWKRWHQEYLIELREHQRCKAKSIYEQQIYEGDVVFIQEDKMPRARWKMGVVEKLNKSVDNKIRGAVVRYIKNGQAITISRPINKLFPVEYKKHEDEILPTFIDENNVVTNT